jgi:ribonuclease VapC
MTVVLDSWAVLAWIQAEAPAQAKVDDLLRHASTGRNEVFMSLINLGEVYYLLARRPGAAAAEQFLADLPTMPIQALLPDRKLVLDAARLKSRFAVSYADAFAVQTALRQKARLMTGDPEILALSKREPVQLMWIGS